MGFVTSGKRKFMNSSLSNNAKSTKRSTQTISGLMNSTNISGNYISQNTVQTNAVGTGSNTRSANKRLENQQGAKDTGKKISNYAKTHIKNNFEFMQKSSRLNTASSKFLSSKLRNNTFVNTTNIENNTKDCVNSDVVNVSKASPKASNKAKKHLIGEQHSIDINPSEMLMHQQSHTYSKENLAEQEAIYCRRLAEFRYQLEKLKRLDETDLLLEKIEATLFDEETLRLKESSSVNFSCFSQFLQQMKNLRTASAENMAVVENWHEMQKNEAMATFNLECSRAVQEFQDKRRELKESLKSENEDRRRQIEADRNHLDINMDITDAKPKVTRKLRRRGNANAGISGADFNVDSSSSCLDATGTSVAIASSLLQVNSSLTGSLAVSGSLSNCIVSSSMSASSQFTSSNILQASQYYSSSSTSILQNVINPALSAVNERKKAKIAPITFMLSEDDINEDLKHLV